MRFVLSLLVGLLACSLVPAHAAESLDLDTPEGIRKALGAREAGTRLAGARAAGSMQDKRLTAPLVRCLKDDEREVRRAAVEALQQRTGKEQKAAARGLAARLATFLKPGADAQEHALVIQALHDLAQPVSIKDLLDVPVTFDRELIRLRALAVANVPAAEAIEELIQFGSRGRRGAGFRDITRDALNYATGQKFRSDPDTWRQWWREAKGEFDFEALAAARGEAREAKAAAERKRAERRAKRERGDDGEPEDEPAPRDSGPGIDQPI